MVSFLQIIGLAAVDAINPCALAVMAIVLMTLLTRNPQNRKMVLWGGLSFTSAVFILYFLYGIVMTQVFSKAIPSTGTFAQYAYVGFGVLSIVLGLLNLKDFLNYKPGSFARSEEHTSELQSQFH